MYNLGINKYCHFNHSDLNRRKKGGAAAAVLDRCIFTYIELTVLDAFNSRVFFGTGALNPGAGFLRIFTIAFDRYG